MVASSGTRTPGQLFALVFGVVYLLVGIAGFFTDTVIVFDVNVTHSIIHVLIGLVWIAGSRTADTARIVNTVIGVAYLAFAVLGFLGILLDEWIDNNTADSFLHLVTGVLSLYFGTAGARATASTA
jgi:hypothetical protein